MKECKNGYLKKIVLTSFTCLLFILMSACTFRNEGNLNPGKITSITFDEVQYKMNMKETFTLVITSRYCRYCDEFYDLMETYLPKHHIEIFDLNIDKATADEEEQFKNEIRKIFPGFVGTPNIFYIEDGQIKSQLNNMDNDLTEDFFDEWVKKYII